MKNGFPSHKIISIGFELLGGKWNMKKSKYHPVSLQHKKAWSLEKENGFKQSHLPVVPFFGGEKKNNSE